MHPLQASHSHIFSRLSGQHHSAHEPVAPAVAADGGPARTAEGIANKRTIQSAIIELIRRDGE